jgi:hypothetical protein
MGATNGGAEPWGRLEILALQAEEAAPTVVPPPPDDGVRVSVLGYHDF